MNETLVNSLVNNGVAATVALAFLIFCWYVLTKSMPQQRKDYLKSLQDHNEGFAKERETVRVANERMITLIMASVDRQTGVIDLLRTEVLRLGRPSLPVPPPTVVSPPGVTTELPPQPAPPKPPPDGWTRPWDNPTL